MSDATERSGRCLCGAVRIVLKTSDAVGVCHCSMCRKWSGGPLFAVESEGDDVHFDGADRISVFGSSDWAERGFCSRCGTHLFYRLKKEKHYAVPVGLLDGEGWIFEQQIFVDEKPPFYSFANDTKNMTGAEVFAQFSAPPE